MLGSWDLVNNTAGGCSQESTFFKNPQFMISVASNTEAIFQLESPDQYPIGLVLFEIEKVGKQRNLSEIPTEELN